jgi:hypothetical protein
LLAGTNGVSDVGRLRKAVLDEWEIVNPAGILELLARPQEMVARAHYHTTANTRLDSGLDRKLSARAIHLQLVLGKQRHIASRVGFNRLDSCAH